MKKVVLTISLVLFCFISYSQNKITGTVKSKDGESLMSTVKVKGSARAVMTDVDGNYSIEVNVGDILEVSSLNMKTKEVKVGSSKIIDVLLEEDLESLDEMIVVAYGTAKKSSYTGAAAVVSEKRIQEAQVSNVSNALQGTGSGVQAISGDGTPGAGSAIRIRGVGSIIASSNPLIVLDGVPYDGHLSSINPTDIASMTVLKDAASASIYGSRAANGVIVISTKQGNTEKEPTISFRSILGISNRAIEPIKLMGTNQWMELRWEALRNGRIDGGDNYVQASQYATNNLMTDIGINPYGSDNPFPVGIDGKLQQGLKLLWNDNWDKAIIGTGQRSETNVDISGGSKNTQYFFSGGYLNEKGMVINSGFERFSTRLNINNQTTKWLKVNLNLNYSYSTQQASSFPSNTKISYYGLEMPNFYPIYQRDRKTGEFIKDLEGNNKYDFGRYRTNSAYQLQNLLSSLPITKNQYDRNQISIRSVAEIDFSEIHSVLEDLKGLKFKISYNTDIAFLENPIMNPIFIADTTDSNGYDVLQNLVNTDINKNTSLTRSYTLNNILSYNKVIDDIHSIDILVGQETYEWSESHTKVSKKGPPIEGFYEPDAATIVNNNKELSGGYSNKYALFSIFSKLDYTLMDKYNISGSYRRDGSSRFHPDNRWGNFWSIGLGWNIEKEDFIKDNLEFIDNLKLRASYGISGNQSFANYYPYTNIYKIYSLVNETAVSLDLGDLGNPAIKWEGNKSLNIGLDYSIFRGRLRGSVEWFQRVSDDLIMRAPVPYSTGQTTLLGNIGEIRNRGIEFDIKGTIIKEDNVRWDLGFNFTHYKNLVTSYPIKEGSPDGKQITMEQTDIYQFYMREWAGNSKTGEITYTYNNTTDKQIVPATNVTAGSPLWWIYDKTTGKRYKTANYDNATEQKQGSALPDFYGGINTDLKIYDFTFSALLSYSIGGQIFVQEDYSKFFGNGFQKGQALSADMINRWTPENQNNDYPRLTNFRDTKFTNNSTRFLYDASFMRLKTVTISYNVPQSLLKDIGIKNLSIFLQGENILTISGVEGIDPESAGLEGITTGRYPVARLFSGGISLKF